MQGETQRAPTISSHRGHPGLALFCEIPNTFSCVCLQECRKYNSQCLGDSGNLRLYPKRDRQVLQVSRMLDGRLLKTQSISFTKCQRESRGPELEAEGWWENPEHDKRGDTHQQPRPSPFSICLTTSLFPMLASQFCEESEHMILSYLQNPKAQ